MTTQSKALSYLYDWPGVLLASHQYLTIRWDGKVTVRGDGCGIRLRGVGIRVKKTEDCLGERLKEEGILVKS